MAGKHVSPEGNEHELQQAMRVVRGAPTPEELATVIAVLEAMHAEEAAAGHGFERQLKTTWARNQNQLRQTIVPGPGQWRRGY